MLASSRYDSSSFSRMSSGFSTRIFAVCARILGVTQGLLPPDERLERWIDRIKLEGGLMIGAALTAGGLAASVYALWRWSAVGFGPLDATRMERVVIPAVAAGFGMMVLGQGVAFAKQLRKGESEFDE